MLAFTIGGTVLGAIGSFVAKIVARFAVARRIDHAAGVPLGALVTAVTLYVALLGTLTVDAWLSPLRGKSAIGVADVAAVQALAKTNPALGAFVEPAMLQTLLEQAATAPVASAQLAQYDAALGYYEETVRPQLLASRIAPVLLAIGEHLPIIGRHVDFPTK